MVPGVRPSRTTTCRGMAVPPILGSSTIDSATLSGRRRWRTQWPGWSRAARSPTYRQPQFPRGSSLPRPGGRHGRSLGSRPRRRRHTRQPEAQRRDRSQKAAGGQDQTSAGFMLTASILLHARASCIWVIVGKGRGTRAPRWLRGAPPTTPDAAHATCSETPDVVHASMTNANAAERDHVGRPH